VVDNVCPRCGQRMGASRVMGAYMWTCRRCHEVFPRASITPITRPSKLREIASQGLEDRLWLWRAPLNGNRAGHWRDLT
jgi:ribosomal protein L37AE/L43A